MKPVSSADVRLVAFYVGGFVLAGAVVGLIRPLMERSNLGIFSGFALGGAIVMNSIAIADEGMRMSAGLWVAMTVLGALFGCAAAYGFLRAGRR